MNGKILSRRWNVDVKHALYHGKGKWYHQLQEFPGALFDSKGYVLFETEEDYRSCSSININQDIWVPQGISSMPEYVQVEIASPISNEDFTKIQQDREREARRLSDEELKKRARSFSKNANAREVSSKVFERNPYVAEITKRRAKGICQLCENPAPFHNKEGNPFLETHHIKWLSQGGEDTIQNTVALCPNCHRQMHILNEKSDRQKLAQKALRPF